MKAITILQPWASLIACAAKQIETRSWVTQYRGPIAIHVAKDFLGAVFILKEFLVFCRNMLRNIINGR